MFLKYVQRKTPMTKSNTRKEGENPTIKHSMKCPKLYGQECNCNPQPITPPPQEHYLDSRTPEERVEDMKTFEESTTTSPPQEQEWEERFDRIAPAQLEIPFGTFNLEPVISPIKEFIRQLLSQTQAEVIREMKKMILENRKDSLWVEQNPETEEFEIAEPDLENHLWGEDMAFGYNQALQDLEAKLKQKYDLLNLNY